MAIKRHYWPIKGADNHPWRQQQQNGCKRRWEKRAVTDLRQSRLIGVKTQGAKVHRAGGLRMKTIKQRLNTLLSAAAADLSLMCFSCQLRRHQSDSDGRETPRPTAQRRLRSRSWTAATTKRENVCQFQDTIEHMAMKKHKQLRNTNNNNSSTVKVAYHVCFVVVVLGCSECRVSDNPSSILTLSRAMLLYGGEASAKSRQKRPHNLQQSHRRVRWRLIERAPSFQITIGQEKNKSFIHGDKTHDLFTSSNHPSINNTQSTAA